MPRAVPTARLEEFRRDRASRYLSKRGASTIGGYYVLGVGGQLIQLGKVSDPEAAAKEVRFHCLGCLVHVEKVGEYAYMVRDEVWDKTGYSKSNDGMLCIGCLEAKLGRLLEHHDFEWRWPINWDAPYHHEHLSRRSDRLKAAMSRRLAKPSP